MKYKLRFGVKVYQNLRVSSKEQYRISIYLLYVIRYVEAQILSAQLFDMKGSLLKEELNFNPRSCTSGFDINFEKRK